MRMIDQPGSIWNRPVVARLGGAFWPAGLGAQVALFLALALAARLGLDGIAAAAGWGPDVLFGPKSDLFADSLKQCLAVRAVSAPLLSDPKVLGWPPLFQQYLFHNAYLGPTISADAQPPLAMLQLMATAKVIVVWGPMLALAVQFILYLYGVLLLKTLLDRQFGAPDSLWLVSLAVCAYPALYMLDRGNFHAGYASLGAILYMLSGYAGRWRGWGMVALCAAINLRPNLAPLMLVEFALHARPWPAMRAIAGMVAGAFAMAVACLGAAHAIDPGYTPAAFLRALRVFDAHYIVQNGGLFWNQSLFGALRCLGSLCGAAACDPLVAGAVSGLAVACAAGFCGLAASGRMTRTEAIFLAFALTTLFSPWNAEYHLIRALGPLLVLCCEVQMRGARLDLRPVLPVLGLLLLAGFVAWRWPAAATALLLLCAVAAASRVLWVQARRVDGLCASEAMMFWACLLLLCPVGGGRSNPIELCGVLLAASAAVAWGCARRPVWRRGKLGYECGHGHDLQG